MITKSEYEADPSKFGLERCRKNHLYTWENSKFGMERGKVKRRCRECVRISSQNHKRGLRRSESTCSRCGETVAPAIYRKIDSKQVPFCAVCVEINDTEYLATLDLSSSAFQIGDRCPNDHLIVASNAEVDKSKGKIHIRCRECRLNKTRRIQGSKPRGLPVAHDSILQRENVLVEQDEKLLEGDISKADDDRPTAPWNILKPTGKTLEALDALNAAMVDKRGNCADNPGPWMDSWLDEDENGEYAEPPAPNRARQMCAGCPLFDVCRNYGSVSRDPGIWGGMRVGLDRRIYE